MKVMELWKSIQSEHKDFLYDLYEHYDYNKDKINMKDYIPAIKDQIPEVHRIRKRPLKITFKCKDGFLKVTIVRGRNCLKFKPEIIWNASKKQLEDNKRR